MTEYYPHQLGLGLPSPVLTHNPHPVREIHYVVHHHPEPHHPVHHSPGYYHPGHHIHYYPHPYQASHPPHALTHSQVPQPIPQVHQHTGHIVHITMYVHHKDITKTVWMWHVTNHHGELVKVSTEVHKTLMACIDNIDHHVRSVAVSETVDITKTTWTWQISRHTGEYVKSSVKVHLSLSACIEDLRQQASADNR